MLIRKKNNKNKIPMVFYIETWFYILRMNLLDRETWEQMETALPKTINIPPKIFNSRNNKLEF